MAIHLDRRFADFRMRQQGCTDLLRDRGVAELLPVLVASTVLELARKLNDARGERLEWMTDSVDD